MYRSSCIVIMAVLVSSCDRGTEVKLQCVPTGNVVIYFSPIDELHSNGEKDGTGCESRLARFLGIDGSGSCVEGVSKSELRTAAERLCASLSAGREICGDQALVDVATVFELEFMKSMEYFNQLLRTKVHGDTDLEEVADRTIWLGYISSVFMFSENRCADSRSTIERVLRLCKSMGRTMCRSSELTEEYIDLVGAQAAFCLRDYDDVISYDQGNEHGVVGPALGFLRALSLFELGRLEEGCDTLRLRKECGVVVGAWESLMGGNPCAVYSEEYRRRNCRRIGQTE